MNKFDTENYWMPDNCTCGHDTVDVLDGYVWCHECELDRTDYFFAGEEPITFRQDMNRLMEIAMEIIANSN